MNGNRLSRILHDGTCFMCFREGMLTRSLPFHRKIMKSVAVGKFSKFVLQASAFNSPAVVDDSTDGHLRARAGWNYSNTLSGAHSWQPRIHQSMSPSSAYFMLVGRTNFPLFFNCAFLSTSIHLSLSPPTVWCLYTFECCVHVFLELMMHRCDPSKGLNGRKLMVFLFARSFPRISVKLRWTRRYQPRHALSPVYDSKFKFSTPTEEGNWMFVRQKALERYRNYETNK